MGLGVLRVRFRVRVRLEDRWVLVRLLKPDVDFDDSGPGLGVIFCGLGSTSRVLGLGVLGLWV